jgi:hypothetical protein
MVNLDELRKKYNQINRVKSDSDNSDFLKRFLMMEEGTTVVRILPAKEEGEDFYAETAIHRIDGRNHHCPRVKGGDCPLCDLSFRLWNTKVEENQSIARQIKATKRFYLNAVERDSGEVKILSMGVKLFSKILDCFFDEDFGDITSTESGHDFKIVKDNQGQWPNYDKSSPKPKKTSAGSDQEIAQWLDELHDIKGLVRVASYEDLKKMALSIAGGEDTPTPNTSTDEEDGDYLSHLKGLGND